MGINPQLLLAQEFPLIAKTIEYSDTVDIHPQNAGIRFKVYHRLWFFESGTFRFYPNRLTNQDSLVVNPGPRYFRVYRKSGSLHFEGGNSRHATELEGRVTYYYPNGVIQKTEFYGLADYNVDGRSEYFGDGPSKVGAWQYFNKKGRLKKERVYLAKRAEDDPKYLTYGFTLKKYNRKGKMNSSRYRELIRIPDYGRK
ncbi:hypothetical protein KFE98_05350 [bacterium SCSIO 12741]|nr:hypothetical protein KFE98_05350 [bacterium SCSIO 12741]